MMTAAGGLLLLGLWLVLWFILSISIIQQIQLIRRTHTTWISALPDTGRVEVVGKVMGERIISPMGGKPCVIWQIEVLRIRKSKNQISWKRIFGKTSPTSCQVDDGTGKILIDPAGAEIILAEGELIEDSQGSILEKLEALGFKEIPTLTKSGNLQVYERRVTDGEEIFVTGHIQRQENLITLIGKPSDPLTIRTQSERETLGKLYGQVVMKGVMTFFIVLGAGIIYYGLLLS